jgi:hypothetical protein
VNSSRYIEHDAYALFDKLMEHTNSWFLSGTRGPAVRSFSRCSCAILALRQVSLSFLLPQSKDIEAEPFADPYADNVCYIPLNVENFFVALL